MTTDVWFVPNLKLNLCRAAHRGSRVPSVPEVYVHIGMAIGVQFLLSPLLSYRSDGPITVLTILVADCDTAQHRSQVRGISLLGGSESQSPPLSRQRTFARTWNCDVNTKIIIRDRWFGWHRFVKLPIIYDLCIGILISHLLTVFRPLLGKP